MGLAVRRTVRGAVQCCSSPCVATAVVELLLLLRTASWTVVQVHVLLVLVLVLAADRSMPVRMGHARAALAHGVRRPSAVLVAVRHAVGWRWYVSAIRESMGRPLGGIPIFHGCTVAVAGASGAPRAVVSHPQLSPAGRDRHGGPGRSRSPGLGGSCRGAVLACPYLLSLSCSSCLLLVVLAACCCCRQQGICRASSSLQATSPAEPHVATPLVSNA